MALSHRFIARQLLGHPLGSQGTFNNPMIHVHLVDHRRGLDWYISEYDPVSRIAKAYVDGVGVGGWMLVSLDDLKPLKQYFFIDQVRID